MELSALGWTFLFRVTKQSKLILPNGEEVTFYDQVSQPGEHYCASGLVFKKRGRIPAHVRVLWNAAAQDRWALVTNDPHLTGWEYAQRMWIEQAFRDLKSHGWQVEQALLTCPQRMARFGSCWLLPMLWLLFLGATLCCKQDAVALPNAVPMALMCVAGVCFGKGGRRSFLPPSHLIYCRPLSHNVERGLRGEVLRDKTIL